MEPLDDEEGGLVSSANGSDDSDGEDLLLQPPPDPDQPYRNEEGFATGLYELYRAYSAYTAVTGPEASRPLLEECVALTDRLAWSLEVAETDYATAPGRLPYVNQRQEHLVGTLLAVLMETDESPEEVLVGLLLSADTAAQAAAARLLVASAPLYSDKVPPPIFHVLREESTFERLTEWVAVTAAEEDAMDPARRALLVFATGLLAVLLLDRDVADYIVRSPVPTALLKRLHRAPQAFDGAEGELPPFVQGLTAPEMARRNVLYGLSCMTAMGEYQEVLAPFFQEDGLALVLQGLQRPELGCRLAAIELTSRLLAHKKFAMTFVQEAAGVDRLVALSEGEQAFQLHAALAMCLFGLASLTNVMEEVCRLPATTFQRLVAYAISLLRCPQEAAQKSIVLFFGMALAFRPILHAFDATAGDHGSSSSSSGSSGSGLYSLLNLLRTGAAAAGAPGGPGSHPPPSVTQRRGQLAHYTTLCLRHHLRVHLAILASAAEADAPPPAPGKRPRLNSQDLTASSAVPSSFFRPVEVDDAATEALLARVRSGVLVLPPDWAPLQNLLHHRGLLVLLGVVASSSTGRAGAAETAKFALDCLEMATLLPAAIEDACLVPLPEQQRTGMQILLEAASGLAQRDADVMRGALRVLCNCLCPRAILPPPTPAHGETAPPPPPAGGGGVVLDPAEETMRRAVRKDLRSKDGIKVLVSLLRYRRCIQAADEVRMLAARALLGMAQEPPIAQILEKMRVSLLLSEVVRAGPVLERAGTDHYAMLRSAALQLIARITGRPASAVSHSDAMDPASWKLEKAAIVTRTSITYESADLLHLIHDHLQAQGLTQAARVLEVEAGLRMPVAGMEEDRMVLAGGSGGGETPAVVSLAAACAARIAAAGEEEGGGGESSMMMLTQDSVASVGGGEGIKSPQSVGGGTPSAASAKPSAKKAKTTAAAASTSKKPVAPPPTSVSRSSSTPTPGSRPFKRAFADMASPTPMHPANFHAAGSSNEPPVSLPPQVRRASSVGVDELDGDGTTISTTIAPIPRRPAAADTGAARAPSPTPTSTAAAVGGSTLQRANRLFPAGLHLRRASRGASPFGGGTQTLSIGRKPRAGYPTPTPSLLDMPSPFPSTYKLPPLPTTVGHGGPIGGHHHHHPHHPSVSTTLDQIVVQYLRRQHEQCPNPICVLPPLSLTLPHRCPEPLITTGAASNVTRRLMQRQVLPPFGGWNGRKLTRSLVFSRFRPWRSYREETGTPLTCSVFPKGAPGRLWAGSEDGSVHLFNLWTSELERSWDCHPYKISSMVTSPFAARPVLLTSAHDPHMMERDSESCLWAPDDLTAPLLKLPGIYAAVFDTGGTRVAGLQHNHNVAQIYDAEIGTLLRTLSLRDALGEAYSSQQQQPNQQLMGGGASSMTPTGASGTPNISFSPAENHLLLCNGVLWDDREPSVVHRFDRLSHGGSNFGAFHPNGNDVLLDGTVWDLRTHSLRTMMPGVEHCAVKFSACGDVLYAYRPGGHEDAESFRNNKRARELTCIQVIDAADYQTIHVQETERNVLDLAVDDVDLYLSVVEGSFTPVGPFFADDAICRLYEVGRRRPDEADSDLDDAHSSEEEDDDWAGEDGSTQSSEESLDLGMLEDDDDSDGSSGTEGSLDGGAVLGAAEEGEEGEEEGEEAGDESSADSSSSGSEDEDEEEGSDDEEEADDTLLAALLQQYADEDSEEDSDYAGDDSDSDSEDEEE